MRRETLLNQITDSVWERNPACRTFWVASGAIQNSAKRIATMVVFLCILLALGSQTAFAQNACPGFRTQTQGGWGQCHINGGNPGTYLANNFAAAFPGGVTIGCTNTATFTSA